MVKGMSMSDGQTITVESAHYNSTVIRMVYGIEHSAPLIMGIYGTQKKSTETQRQEAPVDTPQLGQEWCKDTLPMPHVLHYPPSYRTLFQQMLVRGCGRAHHFQGLQIEAPSKASPPTTQPLIRCSEFTPPGYSRPHQLFQS